MLSRGAGIRTRDLLLPKQARYRTAPHPVGAGENSKVGRGETEDGAATGQPAHEATGYGESEGSWWRPRNKVSEHRFPSSPPSLRTANSVSGLVAKECPKR